MTPLVDALANYRDAIKRVAKDGPGKVFSESDKLRDEILPHLGIKLEDRGNQASRWTFVDKDTLLAELEEKIREKERKEAEKKLIAEKKRIEAELKEKKKRTPASEFFKTFMADEYSKFDDEGIPTHAWVKAGDKDKKGKGKGKDDKKE